MAEPKPEKVAVVEEVRQRLDGAAASVITEYRGLSVKELAELRQSLSQAGCDFKVFKNTLVRRAVADSPHQPLEELLSGPTAIAFVHQDVSAVAKALRDFSRSYPSLVTKGGLLDGTVLNSGDLAALADLPSRDVLLAQMAGALAAPLRQLAGLMEALPRNLAYGLSALVDQGGGVPGPAEAADAAPGPEQAGDAPPTPDVEGAEAGEPGAETGPRSDDAEPEQAGSSTDDQE